MQYKRLKSYLYISLVASTILFSSTIMADDSMNVNTIDANMPVELIDNTVSDSQNVFSNNVDEETDIDDEKEVILDSYKEETRESLSTMEESGFTNSSSQDTLESDHKDMDKTVDESSPQVSQEKIEETVENSVSFRTSKQPIDANQITDVTIGETGLRIQYHPQIPNGTLIKFAVWSDNKGQDDLVWYTAESGGVAYVNFSNHRSYGLYHIHTYSNTNGIIKGLNARTITLDVPKVDAVIESLNNHQYKVSVDNVPQTLSEIVIPVWSNIKGQDDLKWYKANKESATKYSLVVNLSNHHYDIGHYSVHIYGNSRVTKSLVGLTATPGFQVKENQVYNVKSRVENYDKYNPTFDVIVDGSQSLQKVKHVSIAVWSDNKGQDDLKWYQPKIIEGKTKTKISILNHSNTSDNYNVHVYTTYTDNKTFGVNLGKFQIDTSKIKNNVSVEMTTKGLALSLDSNLISEMDKVMFAVWSDVNGQDDLKWYQANKAGEAVASYTNHKGYGTYHIHTYYNNGRYKGLTGRQFTIEKPSVTTEIIKNDDVNYTVFVSNVPYYISQIIVPVWSTNKGQDDLKWYETTKFSDTQYRMTFQIKDHHFDSGHYNVHIYGKSQLEQNRLIGISDSKGFDTGVITLTNPTVVVKNHKPNQASLDVVITIPDNSYDVTTFKVAAWSEKKQENIHWYVLRPTGSKQVTIPVSGKYHQNVVGDYTVHTYLQLSNGKQIGYDLGKYHFDKGTNPSTVKVDYLGTGVHQVKIDNLYSDGDVVYAVWSEKNGQNDLKWYNASKKYLQANGMFNVVNHSDTGTYHIHVYQKQNGKMYFVTATTQTVKRTDYNNMPYYLQWDSRWSGKNYGGQSLGVTGCVPTALSMVYSALSGKDIKPYNVADYLYNQTQEFNRKFAGTSALGILQANKAYGFKSEVLGSQKQLEDNLKTGHYVLAAVQNNKFVSNGSHELVLKGYQNGMTYVTDPWSRQNTGWYPTARLFAERSHAPEDVQGVGVPFIKITD
ncbi:GBS Bsp-like repeat-containing protein [Streptococcus pacificus]|uniref:GBS Bsp-like repeat-containing protein n=1 Tax=Streptococcus pacificus TaxID=2740577 RepID=A0ABS0ZHU5_9STRE|nr:GBS Bsp-like repeat-containing protein [Streptococcus pacificus]MBJ8325568.1 GBS Bsp-like repeat-containing protein [Streptococcus pacificus]